MHLVVFFGFWSVQMLDVSGPLTEVATESPLVSLRADSFVLMGAHLGQLEGLVVHALVVTTVSYEAD